MSDRRRQQVLLVVLLAVLVVVVWWRLGPRLLGHDGGQPGRVMGIGASSSSQQTAKGVLPEVVELRLDDLQAASDDLVGGRDPFSVKQPAPVPPPPDPSQTALREAMERARQARVEEVATVITPTVPRPPPVDVVFLGSFGPARQRFAVFTDGKEIFNAIEGDVLKDRFVVVRIGFESADLGFVGFPEAPAQRLEIGG